MIYIITLCSAVVAIVAFWIFNNANREDNSLRKQNKGEDEKTNRYLDDQILFFNEDGTVCESKGLGKKLTENLTFFMKNIKGIDEDDILLDLSEFDGIPNNDIDGQWHLKNGSQLMKCFSKENFEIEITNFLKQNNISTESAKSKIEKTETSLLHIDVYEGENFTVEVPKMKNESYHLVVIEEKNNSIQSNVFEKETITSIFKEACKLQDENRHEEAIINYNKIIDRLDDKKEKIDDNNWIIEPVIVPSSDDNSSEEIELVGTPVKGVYFNLALSYEQINKFTEAKRAYENFIEIDPNDANVYFNLGITKTKLGDFTTCIADYTNALKIDENYFNAYYNRAIAYCNIKSDLYDISNAKKDLTVYLNQYPEDEAAMKFMDYLNSKA